MALFGFLKGRSRRSVKPYKPGEGSKVDYRPTIAYNPKKVKAKSAKFSHHKQLNFPWKAVLAGLLFVLILVGLVAGVVALLRSPELTIQKFKLLGNRTINDAQVLQVLGKYKGKSMLLTSNETIENDLAGEFNIFNGISVSKLMPDTLFVMISEREPKLVYINLSGAFLVDANGIVLQQIHTNPIDYSPEKINITRGLGDPNSDFLKQQMQIEYLQKMNLLSKPVEEQQANLLKNFDFSLLPLADKQAKLLKLQKQYLAEVALLWDKENQAVDVSVYSTYPRVNVLESALLQSRDKVELARLVLTSDTLNLFQSRKIAINQVVWEGTLLVNFETTDNKTIIFGLNRKVTEQFEDYLLVLNQLKREGRDYCEIDVSAAKIAVRSCH